MGSSQRNEKIGNGMNKGKIKFTFLFLIPLKDNWIFKAIIVPMYCACIAYVKVKCVTTIGGNIGNKDPYTTREEVNIIWR